MKSHDCASLWPLRDAPLRVDAGEDCGSERCGGPMPSSASFSGLSLGLGVESAASSGAAAPLAAGAAGRIGGCWYADPAARQASSAQVPHASARARSSQQRTWRHGDRDLCPLMLRGLVGRQAAVCQS